VSILEKFEALPKSKTRGEGAEALPLPWE